MDSDNFFLFHIDKCENDGNSDSYVMQVYEISENNKEKIEDPVLLKDVLNYILCNEEEETNKYVQTDNDSEPCTRLVEYKQELKIENDYDNNKILQDETVNKNRDFIECDFKSAEEKYKNLNQAQKKIVDTLIQKVVKMYTTVTADNKNINGVSYIDNTYILRDDVEKEEVVYGEDYDYLLKLAKVLAKSSNETKKLLRLQNRKIKTPCEICGKMICQKNLNLHMATVHEDERRFHCPECPSKFKSGKALNAHLNKHLGKKPFICDECPKAYTSINALRSHKYDHQERIHKCEICGQAFTRKYSLKEHIRIHTGDAKRLHCKYCPKSFGKPSRLRRHIKKHYCFAIIAQPVFVDPEEEES